MNKIVRDNYPVANLPDDLRKGLLQEGTVRVVIEQDADVAAKEKLETWAKQYWATKLEDRKPITPEKMLEQIGLLRRLQRPEVSMDDAVARVRALRDEWDDE